MIQSEGAATAKKCRVAILICQSNAVHQLYGQQFMQIFLQTTVNGDDWYEPILWQTSLDKQSVASKIEKIVDGGFEILIVIGQRLSLYVKAAYQEYEIELPTIYIGTSDPLKLGLIESEERCGGQSLAIIPAPVDIGALGRYIGRFSPYLSRICIPYSADSSAGAAEAAALSVKTYLESCGFVVYMRNVMSCSEGAKFLKEIVPCVDSVLIFEACVLTYMMPEIASLCWDNRAVLFLGAGAEGIELGAGAVYGGKAFDSAEKTRQVLEDALRRNACFGDLPVAHLEYERTFIVNEAMLLQLGLPTSFIDELKTMEDVVVWRRWVGRPVI